MLYLQIRFSVSYLVANSKFGVKFCDAIVDSYNNTIETHHHRTMKNLKDH
jgi:hypothetical protein